MAPRLRWFTLGPLLINVLLFGGGLYFGAQEFGQLVDRWTADWPAWLQWLDWLLWLLFAAVGLAVVFFAFALLANLLASPFSGLLAEAVEASLQREAGTPETPAPGESVLAGMLADLRSEVRKLLYFGAWALPLLLLFFIPGLNLVAPVLWFVYGAWALALEYVDFPLANHGIRFRDQRPLCASRRGTLLGFGGTMMVVTLVPVLNFVAVPLGVIGATLLSHREMPAARAASPPVQSPPGAA